ncbi:MAG TPA: hypothetical protein VGR07_09775 [Thermoanaerobaculia bacterium]|jgi:hypothetical protein|nr:hypothetical protein [Thermoanaerobaculia bacterium]
MATDVLQPSQPLPESIETRVMEGDVIRPGQRVYLSFQGDDQAYIATVYSGISYYYPTVGPNRIKLVLKFDSETLKEEGVVKIVTTEQKVGDHNTLGAFTGDHNCYYFTDNYGDKQQWQVSPLQRRPDQTIRFGDRVFLINGSFATQRLTQEGKFLTTAEDGGFWVIEQA